MADKHPAWDQIEPAAAPEAQSKGGWRTRPGQHDIELSKAISLKRIADALDLSNDEGVAHTIWMMAMHEAAR